MTDDRRNLPSASYLEAMSLCPGRWLAQQNLPEQPTDDSKSGDLVHAALAGDTEAREKMDSDQTRTFERLEFRYANLLQQFDFGENSRRLIEERLWSNGQEFNGHSFSGKIDRGELYGIRGLVADFKTGHLEVTPSPSNLQLRAQAVLLWENFGVERVFAAIIPAWQPMPTPVEYDFGDLIEAKREILGIIERAMQPDAPRIPSEKACRYCKAKSRCPEFLASGENAYVTVADTAIRPGLELVSAERLSVALGAIGPAKKYIETLEAEAKRRIASGETIPGWTLKQGEPREKIVALPLVHARAEALGITTEQFTDACSLTKKAAKEMIQNATGFKGGKLDAALDGMIAGCTEKGNKTRAKP